MEPRSGLAAQLGRRIRRARLTSRRTQRAIAAAAGVSQSTISRIELGRGTAIPLRTWEDVAEAVGLDLSTLVHTAYQESAFTRQLQCHRSVVARAALGGWSGWTVVDLHDPAATTTILEREDRHEVAVIHAWDVIANVPDAIRRLWARVDRERGERGPDETIGGAVVIVSSGNNRRRLTESAAAVVAGIDVFSPDWWAALGSIRVPMPTEVGTLWTDVMLTRLRPRIPYVDGRTRHPDRPSSGDRAARPLLGRGRASKSGKMRR